MNLDNMHRTETFVVGKLYLCDDKKDAEKCGRTRSITICRCYRNEPDEHYVDFEDLANVLGEVDKGDHNGEWLYEAEDRVYFDMYEIDPETHPEYTL